MVGHADGVAVDRIGDGDRRVPHQDAGAGQVGRGGIFEAGIVGAGEGAHGADLAWRALQREAGIGAADVGQQARAIDVEGSVRAGMHGVSSVQRAACARKSRYQRALSFSVRRWVW